MGGYEVIAPSAPFSVYNKRRIATGIKTIIGPLRKKKKKKEKKKRHTVGLPHIHLAYGKTRMDG